MGDDPIGLKDLARSLAIKRLAQAGKHLTLEEAESYHFRRMPPDATIRTRSHLMMCRRCASLFSDFAAFCGSEDDPSLVSSPEEIEAGWAALQAQIRAETSEPAPAQSSGQILLGRQLFLQKLKQRIAPHFPAYAAAALLMLGLSLTVWLVALKRESRTLTAQLSRLEEERNRKVSVSAETRTQAESAPGQKEEAEAKLEQLATQVAELRNVNDQLTQQQFNLWVVELPDPRDGNEIFKIELPRDLLFMTLIIPGPKSEPDSTYPDYALRIVNTRGAQVQPEMPLRRDHKGDFAAPLQCRILPAGDYIFSVYGLGRGKKAPISENIVRVRYE